MAYTAQQVLDAAVERSDLNSPDLVPPAQILTYLSQFERAAFLKAARMNPEYFGTDAVSGTRTAATQTWDLSTTPGRIAAVDRAYVETIVGTVTGVAVGDRVNLVSMKYPDVDIAPRATLRGKIIKAYGDELGASTNYVSVLRIYYSPLPNTLGSLTQSVTLPDEWIDLMILPLAKILALRDGRVEELQALDLELVAWAGMFEEALLVYDSGVRRPLVSVPNVPLAMGPRG